MGQFLGLAYLYLLEHLETAGLVSFSGAYDGQLYRSGSSTHAVDEVLGWVPRCIRNGVTESSRLRGTLLETRAVSSHRDRVSIDESVRLLQRVGPGWSAAPRANTRRLH